MAPRSLQEVTEGTVTSADDADYEARRRAVIWNRLTPNRRPCVIVEAASEADVIEAVGYARANRLRVAVRGGGHSWVGFPLRDDSLLIDLGRLDKVSVDRAARAATIQPAVRSREFNRLLAPLGLAFPVGHCPTVPMSGFLLSGGLGWNSNTWGPACFSIEAARVVAADGSVLVASEKQNPDLLWAVRGGGPGFFGVVTEFSLRLYPLPGAITTANYFYSLDQVEDVGAWAARVARELSKEVELCLFIAAAPPAIADRCRPFNGFACLVTATAFLDDPREAASTLALLDRCPASKHALLKEPGLSTPIDALHDAGATLFPEEHRYLADTLWTNSPPANILATSREHFMRAPSSKSFQLFSLSTGPERPTSGDGAYSMSADELLACYAVWERSEDDAPNTTWHRNVIAALDAYAIGHYVGESDIAAHPERAERAYSRASWSRLQMLRHRYDPDRLFHGQFGAD
jgi:FAD/FMN-containing dehydrogenase